VAFSRDGNTVATGGFDGTARLWNARSGAQTMLLEKRTTVVKSLAFSPTQDLLATADKLGDNIVRIWNAADGKLVRELPPEVTGIESLAFSPDGKLLVTGTTRTAQVAIWSTATWRKTQSLPVSYCTWALAFSPDGNHLACGSRESVARICSKRQQSFLESFLSAGGAEWAVTNALKGHSHYVDALAYSPDGRFLLTGSSDRTSKIWSASASRDITELHVPWNATWPYAWALKFTPDNHSIAAATAEDPYIRIWDLHTGAETMRLGPHPTYARSLDVSPDGKLLIAAADGARLWNLSTGECSLLVDQSPPLVEGVAFSPDGKSIAAARGSNAELWDVASKQLIRRIALPDGLLFRIRFSPDGKCLAATTPPTRLPCKLFVWDLGNPANPLFTKSIGDRIDQLAFSPDGQRIAVTSGRAPLVLDSKTGRELLSLGGHVDYVTAFAFSPDGARLVTATVNGSISVWDAADGRELLNLGRTAPWLYAADFSGDGRCFAVGGRRGDNGAGILVLKAFPWDTALSGDDQPAGDEPFAALKRKEFERLLTTSAQPSKTIEYSIKTK
jgi:WD40 repeat protein